MENMVFDSIKTTELPLAEQVADQVSRLIIDQHLKTGEKLPNEFLLAEQLNVGRGTVREAVKILVSRNVLEIRRGRGTFVANHPGMVDDPWGFAFTQDKYQLSRDLWEVREIVEPRAAALAAERATDEEIRRIRDLCVEVERAINTKISHMQPDAEFHASILASTKNQALIQLQPIIKYGVELFMHNTNYILRDETIHTHRLIVDAISRRDAQAAQDAMWEHLKVNIEVINKSLK